MPPEDSGGDAPQGAKWGRQAAVTITAVVLSTVVLMAAMAWKLAGEHADERAAYRETLRDQGRNAAGRIERVVTEQRLELERLALARNEHLQTLGGQGGDATVGADLARALQKRFPEFLAVEVIDPDGRTLASSGLAVSDGESLESLRATIARGRSAMVLNLDGVTPHYALLVPLQLATGTGALLARMSDSALANPLEWFEAPGNRHYLVDVAHPDQPLLAAQRPFDLRRGMPARGRIAAARGITSPVFGTDLAVVTIAEAGPGTGRASRYFAGGAVGAVLLLGLAWLLVDRIALGEKRRREDRVKARQYLLRLEAEVATRTRDLERTRAGLEAAQRIALVGSFEFDLRADRWTSSPTLDDIFGIDTGFERTLAGWLDLALPADREAMAGYFADLVAHCRPCDRIYRIRRWNDGAVRWVHGRGECVVDAEGRATHLRGTVQDITPLKEAEDALRESEARANLILDTVPEGMLVVDGEGRIVRHNRECSRMFGYEGDEMLGLQVEALVLPEVRHRHAELRRRYDGATDPRMMGAARDLRAVRRDGSEFHAEIGLGPVTIAGTPHVVVMVSDVSERIAAESALRRFREVMDTSGDLLAFIDPELRYGICNPAYAAQYGMTPDDLQGRFLAEVMPAALFAEIEPHLRRALAGDTVANVTTRTEVSGRQRLYEAEYRPFAAAGGVEGIVASLHDVTLRVESEQALRESELKVRAMLDTPFINMGLLDPEGRILLINAKALKAAGMSMDNLAGRPFWEGPWYNHDPRARARIRQAVEAAVAGEASRFETTSSLADGEVRHKDFMIQPIRDKAGRLAWIVVQSIDITEAVAARRSLERQQETLEAMVAERTAELARSEDKFRGLVEQTMVSIYIIADGKFAYVNPGHVRMFGYDSADEIIDSMSFLDCVAPECRELVKSRVEDRLTGRAAVSQYTFTALRRDGSRFEIEVRGRLLEYQGKPAVIGIATDVTERQRLDQAREAALAEARRLADARSEFLANMSHEIRTPLNAVLGLAQVGLRDSQGRQMAGIFKRILDSGQTLLAVVNDILDFSKIEAGKLTLEDAPFDLGAVIDQAVRMIAPRAYDKGLDLRIDEAPGLPPRFRGDSTRLTQVLLNLLSNAVKFTPAGSVGLAASMEGQRLLLRITDTGIGIAADHIGRLFQAFEQADGSTTRRFGGTGLGLSIVHRLVKLMGGTVAVDSEPGRGSTFEVRLPLPVEAAPTRPGFAGRVGLVRLPEAQSVVAALRRGGVSAAVLEPGEALGIPPEVLLLDAALAGEPETLAALIAAARRAGSAAALVVTPGSRELPAGTHDLLPCLERPLHPRSVLAVRTASAAETRAPSAYQRLAGLSILAAEDNEVNRLVLEEMLVAEGARLVCLENGQQALGRLATDGTDAFQAVITDIQMPELDGYGLARRLKEIAPALPVIGLTAHAMPEEHSRCLAAGMADQLAKPVDLEALVATLLRLAEWPGKTCRGVEESPAAKLAPDRSQGKGDWAGLEARYGSKPGFVNRLVASFGTAHADTPETLRRLAAAGDFAGLRFQAHTLKGVLGNLMAREAMDLAARTEQLARAGHPAARAEAEALARAVESLLAAARRRTALPA